ncbi:MAG: hypothetical protein E7260_10975 [Lachnospiraceae bacterium]|nr:hypothetical protein [Lachnospiraceae bacterium]
MAEVSIDNPVLMAANYIQVGEPDIDELALLIKKAKGTERTMAKFAEECGVSSSMFSRIANKKFAQPLSLEVMGKICVHAANDAGITIADLTRANGMAWKDNYAVRATSVFGIEVKIRNLVATSLVERGISVAKLNSIPEETGIPKALCSSGRGIVMFEVHAYFTRFLRCYVMAPTLFKQAGKKTADMEVDYEREADNLFRRVAEVFLLDIWEEEKLREVMNTFVFHDRNLFEAFYKRVKDAKVNNWISILLVNTERQHIEKELILPRKDGKEEESVFLRRPEQGEEADFWWDD